MLITRDAGLAKSLRERFGEDLHASHAWPPYADLPWDVLIVDARDASVSIWLHLERLARTSASPSLVLLDEENVPRERLARVKAEALIPRNTSIDEVAEGIRLCRIDHAFHAAGMEIAASPALPHPLSKYLGAALSGKLATVRTLAQSLGMSESTLRNQWRACRTDPTLRLQDLVRRAAAIRAAAEASHSDGDWRIALDELVGIISASSVPPIRTM